MIDRQWEPVLEKARDANVGDRLRDTVLGHLLT